VFRKKQYTIPKNRGGEKSNDQINRRSPKRRTIEELYNWLLKGVHPEKKKIDRIQPVGKSESSRPSNSPQVNYSSHLIRQTR
jgi:hypothetical protein